MYSFSVKSMTMGETGSVQLDLYSGCGGKILRSRISSFPLRSPKSSTAVGIPILRSEGAKQLVVAQGKSSGAITL